MTITCDLGTTFTIKNNVLTITRTDQPECSIPMADLREFVDLIEFGDDDDVEDVEE